MSTRSAPGRRPPELDDRAWLETQLATKGQSTIAKELGVARGTVQRACDQLGIPPRPRGRRRGVSPAAAQEAARPPVLADLIISRRFHRDLDLDVEPNMKLIARRFLELGDASKRSDILAIREALISLGAGCALMLHHLHQWEQA